MSGFFLQLDQKAIRRMTKSPDGLVGKDVYRRARAVEARAKRLAPVATGRLRASISIQIGQSRGEVAMRIGTKVKYARYVHDGTGIYGPRGRPIRPTRGKFMVFTPRGSNQPVFAREVRGMRGRPFMLNALKAAV